MTTVTGTTPTSSSSSSSSSSASAARTSLTSNFQTFLTLLTTQLQNQDPTSPMDSNQFTQQLVQYSQVEQQINTNDKLDSLISLGNNQTTSLAMSYLGKSVTLSNGMGQLASGQSNWNYTLDAAGKSATLTVTDSNGNVVYSAPGNTAPGLHSFAWNGNNSAGDPEPDGLYTLTVSATDSNGNAITTSVASTVKIDGVDLSGSSPQLVIGNSEIALGNVSLVTN